MSIVVYQDVATPIVPTGDLALDVRNALGSSLRSMRYPTPDFAGLYQDAAGTTPVASVGQPVGLMLDRRFGLERGAVVFSEDWYSSGAGWTPQGIFAEESTVVYEGGRVVISYGDGGVAGGVFRDVSLPPGTYEATTEAGSSGTGGAIRFSAYGGFSPISSELSAGGVVSDRSAVFMSSGAGARIYLRAVRSSQLTVGAISIREIPGNHAYQPTTTARPALRSGPLRIDYDGVDDYLRTEFPALGSNVTIARAIPGTGAQILTGQTIAAGNWDDNVDSCATLVIDRALTGPETALVTAFLNQQAGV